MDRVKETLYETKDYRGELTPPIEAMFVNLVHYRAMPLQIRQVRVKQGELFYPTTYMYDGILQCDLLARFVN